MQQIFLYPNIEIVPSKSVTEDLGQRVIIVNRIPIPADMQSFYDKNIFNYNSMFINVGNEYSLISKSFTANNNSIQIQRKQKNEQNIVEKINQNENGHDNYDNESSDWGVNKIEQINKQTHKDYDNFLSSINNDEMQYKQSKISVNNQHRQQMGSSAISGLNQVTVAQQSFNPIIDRNIENDKIIKQKNTQQILYQQQQNDQIDLQFEEEISSIRFNQNQNKDLLTLLNSYEENQIVSNEDQIQISKKRNQLQGRPYRRLIYRIKIQNCCKVTLKFIVDPYGRHAKAKKNKTQEYLKLNKKTMLIESHSKILNWEIGEAKVQIEPLLVSANCSNCRKQRNGFVNNRYCSMICENQECSKQIIIQFQQIALVSHH